MGDRLKQLGALKPSAISISRKIGLEVVEAIWLEDSTCFLPQAREPPLNGCKTLE